MERIVFVCGMLNGCRNGQMQSLEMHCVKLNNDLYLRGQYVATVSIYEQLYYGLGLGLGIYTLFTRAYRYWRRGVAVECRTRDQSWVRVSAGHYGVKTLGKFLTPMCLCDQAV